MQFPATVLGLPRVAIHRGHYGEQAVYVRAGGFYPCVIISTPSGDIGYEACLDWDRATRLRGRGCSAEDAISDLRMDVKRRSREMHEAGR